MPLHAFLWCILVLPPFIHSPAFHPPSIRLPPAFLSHRDIHTEYPIIKEKAATCNYEQDVSLLTDLLVQLGDVQLKKTLGKARRKGHDGAENTQAGEGVGGGGRRDDVGGVEGGGGEGVKGFMEAEVTFEMTPV